MNINVPFSDYLRANGYWSIVPIDDQYYACLCDFMYTCAILKGRWGDPYGYEDRWCYDSRESAQGALVNWFLNDDRDPEPTGWHRHPSSGRRRPDGDASKEYVNR